MNSFQTTCPERGWKHCHALVFLTQFHFLSKPLAPKGDGNRRNNQSSGNSVSFPNHLPRKGMETLTHQACGFGSIKSCLYLIEQHDCRLCPHFRLEINFKAHIRSTLKRTKILAQSYEGRLCVLA